MMQIQSVQCVKCHWRLLHDTAVTQPATEMEGRPLHVTCHKKKKITSENPHIIALRNKRPFWSPACTTPRQHAPSPPRPRAVAHIVYMTNLRCCLCCSSYLCDIVKAVTSADVFNHGNAVSVSDIKSCTTTALAHSNFSLPPSSPPPPLFLILK